MITLSFGRSSSVLFKKAVALAESLPGYELVNDQHQELKHDRHQIKADLSDIFSNWAKFEELYALAGGWKSFSLVVESNLDQSSYQIFYGLSELHKCIERRTVAQFKEKYCTSKHWPCLLVNSVNMDPFYYTRSWYLHGHFSDDFSRWVIHKEDIKRVLADEIKIKMLSSCPFFNQESVMRLADDLPDEIYLVDNKSFEIQYQQKFVDGELKDVPFGVYHRRSENQFDRISISVAIEKLEKPADDTNPYPYGSDDWSNWEIDNHLKKL